MEFKLKNKNTKKALGLFVALAALFLAVISVQKIQTYLSQALTPSAKVYFAPSTVELPPDQTVSVMVDSDDSKVGFVSLSLNFDVNKVRLSSDVTITAPFTTIVTKTAMSEANSTGVVNLVVAVAPADRAAAPSGIFEVAKLPLHLISTQDNDTSTVTNNSASSQIVDLDVQELAITSEALALNMNVVATSPAGSVDMQVQAPGSNVSGQPFAANIVLDTKGFSIVGTDLVIDFDSQKLTLNSATNAVFSQLRNEVIDNTTGKYSASLFVNTGEPAVTGANLGILTLNFTSKQTGSANISISNTSVVAGTGEVGQNLSIAALNASVNVTGPTPNPTVAPTPEPTNPPTQSGATPTPVVNPTPTPTTVAVATPTTAPVPTATPVVIVAADINSDTSVNIADYLLLFQYYGRVNPSLARADINRDGVVNIRDYAILYESFGF